MHRRPGRRRDEGAILVLTLLLTIVLASIVLAIATYAATGLRTSKVTTERTESNAAARSALTWVIEEFAKKQLAPDDPATCGTSPTTIPLPAGLVDTGAVTVTCTTATASSRNNPQVLLESRATTAAGTARSIDVLLEVPAAQYTTQVNSWVVH